MTTVAAGESVLDEVVWQSLTGAHARFAERLGHAARYHRDIAPFHALADPADPAAWTDLARLAGPGAEVAVAGPVPDVHPGWERVDRIPGVQLVDIALRAEPDPEAAVLTEADVPEMIDLVERTPFLHTGAANGTAIRLYESIGFRLRRHTTFAGYRSTA